MVAQQLVAGHRNVDHQRKILAEADTLTTLEAKVKRLQLLETTEESAGILRGSVQDKPAAVALQRSQYKKNQRTLTPKTSDAPEPPRDDACGWCGETTHPGGKPLLKQFCTAKDKKCNNCHIKGHLSKVCRKSRSAPVTEDTQNVDEPLPDIPASASVSFSFAASNDVGAIPRVEDFRLSRTPNGNT